MCLLVAQSCLTLWPMVYSPPGSSVHGILQEKNTRVGSHSLLQGFFPTQESNPALLRCRPILYTLSHWGSPEECWSGLPFPVLILPHRDQTQISCIGRWTLYHRATRKASGSPIYFIHSINSVHVSTPISQILPPHLFPPWYPYICSLHLCLYFFFEITSSILFS